MSESKWKTSVFNGDKYTIWRSRIDSEIEAIFTEAESAYLNVSLKTEEYDALSIEIKLKYEKAKLKMHKAGAKAKKLIKESVSDDILPKIINCTSAASMLAMLDEEYKPKTSRSKILLLHHYQGG